MRNVRPVILRTKAEAEQQLRTLGVSAPGIQLMAEKCLGDPVLVRDVACGEGNILKQEMLVLGGDAAIHRHVITGRIDRSDVLLMGSRKQMRRLAESLARQSFGLPAVGQELQRCLDLPAERTFTCGDRSLVLGGRTAVMGIVNVTPDSFSDGGQFLDTGKAAAHGRSLAEEGAAVIDIGGESSRPGAEPVSAETERERVVAVVEQLSGPEARPVSIDTRKPAVAAAALAAGAVIVNDINGFRDPVMLETAAAHDAGIVIMHMQGDPRTMQDDPCYGRVVDDVMAFLDQQAAAAISRGIRPTSIMIDPGIGFGKTAAHNLEILKHIAEFRALGFPVLVGASRKSFIGTTLGLAAGERLPADIAVTAFCASQGVDMVRVHDVHASAAACGMVRCILDGQEADE